ncbi:protein kri1, partial [Carica papaya]|uniref:protein kri1 n=1 Tax=Carica papaya TaxID=3649 RepID=UPI000B8CF777
MKLFDDDDGQNEDISKIEIDKEYACKFEHNKKREDLQRYEELKKKGLIEESEESDDESEESESEEDNNRTIMSKQKDLEFFSALIKVRNQDPSLKKKDIKLFESDESEGESENEEDDAKREKGKKKAMYLKDVVAKHLIEEGPEFKDEEEHLNGKEERKKTYDEEQEELRKAFLDAAEVAEDNDQSDFLTLKANHQKFDDGDNQAFVNKLDEYFGRDGELDESNVFLKEFFMNKMWVDKGNK